MIPNPSILFFGAGAVGSSVGGWLAAHYKDVCFYDMGPIAEALKKRGVTTYLQGEKEKAVTTPVRIVTDLGELASRPPDVIVVSVKNYSLDAVAKLIKDRFGDQPIIVALQNGVENQAILPKYFTKVIYGVVSYNAWLDEPGVVGYQKKGPLVLGALNESLKADLERIAMIFNRGVETLVTPHLQDAAHSKMVINLTNSLTTLIGHKIRPISDPKLFQKLLTNLTYEGVKIVKAAGYRECKLGGMPPWRTIRAAAKLPQFLTKRIFEKNVSKMVMSSMAQDILQRGSSNSELESLNGYFLKLAEKHGVDVPFNRAVYELCNEKFGKPGFEPLDVKDVWAKVQERMSA